MHEATVLGVAYAAGKALNIWRARMEDETVTHQEIFVSLFTVEDRPLIGHL
jgi:glycerol kinase